MATNDLTQVKILGPPRLSAEMTDAQKFRAITEWMWDYFKALGLEIDLPTTLNSIQSRLDTLETIAGTFTEIEFLSQSISSPPTQAQVEAIQDKLNVTITLLNLITGTIEEAGL